MKRTGFANKPRKPLKRSGFKQRTTPLKKKSSSPKKKQTSISTLKKKLWTHFSLYIRNRDKWTCYTCGRKAEGSGLHSGHFISKSVGGISLYFHEKNVNAQCYNCNINLSGNIWIYGQKLGEKTVAELYEIKGQTAKWTVDDYLEKIAYYKGVNDLSTRKFESD